MLTRRIATLLVTLTTLTAVAGQASAHCEVPCGIYDDHARVHQMLEDVTTVERAIAKIGELAGKTDAQSANQLVRWINTKEMHATRIQTTIAQYFLTQRIAAPKDAKDAAAAKRYAALLIDHHRVLRAAMKAKQSADAKDGSALRDAVEAIGGYWPAK